MTSSLLSRPLPHDAAEQAYRTLLSALQETRNADPRDWRVIGIHTGGAWIAQRLAQDLALPEPGRLDISFYRDDFSRIGLHPQVRPSTMPFDLEGAAILLVDDVLLSGRTIRVAMNALFDYGRPARIDLAVLVDRISPHRHTRELPIAPTFSGATMSLAPHDHLVLKQTAHGLQFTLEPA